MYLIHYPSPSEARIYKLGSASLMAGVLTVDLTPQGDGPIVPRRVSVPREFAVSDQAAWDWLVGIDGPYAGASLVPEEDFAFQSLQIDLLQKVKARRNARRDGGAVTTYGTVDTDIDSRLNINGAVTMALIANMNAQPFSQPWRLQDNSFITLDAAGMIDMGMQVGQFVATVQARKNTLDAAIGGATTVAELQAIDIDRGWPE